MTTFIFGEAMLEYHSNGGSGLRYGGDTLNTAIHLARAGHDVSYVTAVGTDPISDALVDAWQAEGLSTRHVLRHPGRSPGIYAIYLDENGERSFLYWRDESAAREMFTLPGMNEALEAAEDARLVYSSLISLAIVDEEGRRKLTEMAAARKAKGKPVAYDSNFRALLWPYRPTAREASQRMMESATIGLPTNADECELWGRAEAEEAIVSRWIAVGMDTVVVKAAERGCFRGEGGQDTIHVHDARLVEVVDTSGAGDAFNAGFLGGILSDAPIDDCIEAGQDLARKVIGKQGALPRV